MEGQEISKSDLFKDKIYKNRFDREIFLETMMMMLIMLMMMMVVMSTSPTPNPISEASSAVSVTEETARPKQFSPT